MNRTHILQRIAGLAVLGFASGCVGERAATPAAPDSAAASSAALDTLRRLGAREYVVDSLVRHGDTAAVWAGPRVWMATDRSLWWRPRGLSESGRWTADRPARERSNVALKLTGAVVRPLMAPAHFSMQSLDT